MLSLIYGRPGSGKSRYLADKLVSRLTGSREALLIVSDQDAVNAESLIAGRLCSDGLEKHLMSVDILSFRRLANRIFREYGGIESNYIGRGGKLLVMWNILESLSPSLKYYRGIAARDTQTAQHLLDGITTLQRHAITGADLMRLSEKVTGNPAFSDKLFDLSLIRCAWTEAIHEIGSDSEEDLDRLDAMLRNGSCAGFFADKDVYIDSFSAFSGQEYAIIGDILRLCPEVTVTLGIRPGDSRDQDERILRTEQAILRIARKENVKTVRERVCDGYRSQMPALRRISDCIFSSLPQSEDIDAPCTDGLSLVSCADSFDECEAAAKGILRYIQETKGARWRDCAVTMRASSDYAGIIDGVFAMHGIPFYSSVRADITSMSAVRLISSALAIKRSNWRSEDVLTYLKTGFCSLSDDETFLLEGYIRTWNIEGRRRYEEFDWSMSPDGYGGDMSESNAEALEGINALRLRFIPPLVRFCDSFSKDTTVRDVCAAIYQLMCDLGVQEKLSHGADTAGGAQAQQLIQLWNVIVGCLDEIVAAAGDNVIGVRHFSELFSSVISTKTLATIPTTVDEVLICDAYNLRSNNVAMVWVIGANDGIFPATVTETGLFADRELEIAENAGVSLPGGSGCAADDEFHFFYSAVCAPARALCVSYHRASPDGGEARPSLGFFALQSLFPGIKTTDFSSVPPIDRIYGKNACLSMAKRSGGAAERALFNYYSADPAMRSSLFALDYNAAESISGDISGTVYPREMALSQSRINAFVSCPFSYCCKYVLRLSEEKTPEPGSTEVGTIMHFILEHAMRGTHTYGNARRELTDDEIAHAVNAAITEYKEKVCGNTQISARTLALFRRMKKTAKLLLTNLRDEFAQSEFVPVAFELPVGNHEEGKPYIPPLSFDCGDGTGVLLNGKIDRLDVWHSGSDVFLRVVDYKTGDRDFSLSDVKLGLNAQLLLYMMALLSNKSSVAALAGEGTLKAAGVIYYIAKLPDTEGEYGTASSFDSAKASVKHSGLLIGDESVLRAMEKNLEGKFIPAKEGKRGLGGSICDADGFADLLSQLSDTVISISRNIRSGNSSIAPIKTKSADGCKYCPMLPVCRKEKSVDSEEGDEDGCE